MGKKRRGDGIVDAFITLIVVVFLAAVGIYVFVVMGGAFFQLIGGFSLLIFGLGIVGLIAVVIGAIIALGKAIGG